MENLEKYKEAVKGLAQQYELRLMILFGSRATKRVHSESDTDIAVSAAEALTLEKRLSLARDLDRVFKDVEVIDIKTAPPLLLASIANEGIELYAARDGLFEEFRVFAMNQYFDTAPLRASKRRS